MKRLFLVSLMVSALASSATAATELCSGGNLAQTSSATGATTVTNCQWPTGAEITADATATSLVVSKGSAAGNVVLNFGTPTNAFAFTISSFSAAGQLVISGTLGAGSSVSITDLTLTIPAATVGYGNFLDFSGLHLTDSSFTIAESTLTSAWSCGTGCGGIFTPSSTRTNIVIRDSKISLTSSGKLLGVMSDEPLFEDATMTISGNTITGGSGGDTSYGLSLDRISAIFPLRKSFSGMAIGDNSTAAARALRHHQRQRGAAADAQHHAFAPAAIDWAGMSDATARAAYGKVTYKITDNTFVNVDQLWSIHEPYGADIIITGNTASIKSGVAKSVYGSITLTGDNYPIAVTISDNALTASNGQDASLYIYCNNVPVKSVFTVSKNVITTGKNTDVAILRLPMATYLPAVDLAKFTVSANRLVALDGTTGIQWQTNVISYTKTNVNAGGKSHGGTMALCNNVLFGTTVNTDALAESTFYYADKPIPLAPVSECGAPNGAPSAHFGAACGVLLSATAAMAIAAFV